jgi:hypothetical protein
MKPYAYAIQQYTGKRYGWETVTREDSYEEALKRVREYRLNQPELAARIKIVPAYRA